MAGWVGAHLGGCEAVTPYLQVQGHKEALYSHLHSCKERDKEKRSAGGGGGKQKAWGQKRKISGVEKPKAMQTLKLEAGKGNVKVLKNKKMEIDKAIFYSFIRIVAFVPLCNDFLMSGSDTWITQSQTAFENISSIHQVTRVWDRSSPL